ncbi:MAG TPA: hypothetical protein P5556_11130 [Candidatus Gastranaerophilales bacterium]|nr:hypothetical protein [Candidatus Gastranaerophilales bacterium]
MKSENKKLIGIWGYPEPDILEKIKNKYPENKIIDLDINYNNPSSGILPDAYCRITKNMIDNSFAMKENLEVIIASVGREKCDSGWFAAKILKDEGFNVIETRYEDYNGKICATPVCKSNLALKEKINLIMDNIIQKQNIKLVETKPEFGFWGVPPNDFNFLDIFPETTHVYGWTRCVEAGRPADIDLEMYVDENIPTVFFAQTFCAKMQLAKYLAKKHNGIYVDVDDVASNSVKAKIEAFIKLR